MNEELELLRDKKGFICDMDGVIYHGNRLLPGVPEFVDWLQRENKSFLFLTNSSERSPLELQQKLARLMMSAGFGDIDMEGKYVAIFCAGYREVHRQPEAARICVCYRCARSGRCAVRGGHRDERC